MYDRMPFQLARSDYLDSFYSVESEVIRLLTLGGFEIKADCFGVKLKTLSGIKASPKLSKASVAEVATVCGLLHPFLPVRADIVHSRLEVVILNGAPHVVFSNAKQDRSHGTLLRAFTYEQLLQESQVLRQYAARLSQIGISKRSQPQLPASISETLDVTTEGVPILA